MFNDRDAFIPAWANPTKEVYETEKISDETSGGGRYLGRSPWIAGGLKEAGAESKILKLGAPVPLTGPAGQWGAECQVQHGIFKTIL